MRKMLVMQRNHTTCSPHGNGLESHLPREDLGEPVLCRLGFPVGGDSMCISLQTHKLNRHFLGLLGLGFLPLSNV